MMPIGMGKEFHGVSEEELLRILGEKLPRFSLYVGEPLGNGPCHYYDVDGFSGKIGFISAVSHKFCGECNRIRLTSQGFLKTCLQYAAGRDLREVIRSGGLDEVLKALEILTASYGYAWSPKRITLSTVGLRKGLQRFIEESDCHLAISLHSPLPSQRSDLMPAERAFSIVEIVNLLKNYDFSKQRRLSFEYIVFRGVNDSLIYAKELVKLLRGLDCRMNLIRFHAIPDVDLNGADMEMMTAFRDYLTSHGLFSTIRSSRGEDIFAACGMLSTAKQEENNKN